MPFQRKVALACALLLAVDLIVYLLTLAPTVQFIDSGELAVVCKTLGVAHPTGYPLYTMVGRLFCLLPSGDIIFRVSLMSLLFTCAASLVLFFILLSVTQTLGKSKKRPPADMVWPAFLTALIFSFTPTLWSQGTSNEVYSLNVLFYAMIILLVFAWRKARRRPTGERILCLLAFAYALSFGNHMSTILLLPALLFIVTITLGKRIFSTRRIILILGLFLLGLSIYVFLPIRSSLNPVMDWGNPESWTAFKRHVTGWQYQVWMFAQSTQQLTSNLGNFLKLFLHQFPLYLLPFSLLGIWWLFLRDGRMLIFLSIVFVANVFYGINYDITDLDPYFLGAFLVNAIFIGVGLNYLFLMLRQKRIKKGIFQTILIAFVLLPLITLLKNYRDADRSQNFYAYDLAANTMRSVKKDAVALTNIFDHYSPWLYLRYIENKRLDVRYLDTQLCRLSWHLDYIKQAYPDLYRRSQSEIKDFFKKVVPYEDGHPYDPDIIQKAYENMLNSFIFNNIEDRPLYDGKMGGPKLGEGLFRVPEGMIFALKDSLKYRPFDFPDFELRGVLDESIFKDPRTLFNLKKYPQMINLRIKYLSDFGQQSEAEKLGTKYRVLLSQPIR
jgi:hypothetical protein